VIFYNGIVQHRGIAPTLWRGMPLWTLQRPLPQQHQPPTPNGQKPLHHHRTRRAALHDLHRAGMATRIHPSRNRTNPQTAGVISNNTQAYAFTVM